MIAEIYKGIGIDFNIYGNGYTVFFDGDDIIFETIAEAKQFIDTITQ